MYYSLGQHFLIQFSSLWLFHKKCAIRIVCGAQKFDHTYPLFQLTKILLLRNLYVYTALLFLYKYYRQSLPICFLILHHKWNSPDHCTRQIKHFRTHLTKSFQRATTLRCTGVKMNNYFMNRLNYNHYDGVYKPKIKEHFLMNDISHLYGGTWYLSTLDKKLHVVHLVF